MYYLSRSGDFTLFLDNTRMERLELLTLIRIAVFLENRNLTSMFDVCQHVRYNGEAATE